MTILIAPDQFKGSLSAYEVCYALQQGIHKVDPKTNAILCPMADGGDGSLAILKEYLGLEEVRIRVKDPLFREVEATYSISNGRAYIEMSAASGWELLTVGERNCMETTTYGTGQLIIDAIEKGIRDVYLFIGGSATNDAGVGMAAALGYLFLDKDGNELLPVGKNLAEVHTIDDSNLKFNLEGITMKVICDVQNPLYGEQGAAFCYAAQKGAKEKDIIHLDKGLRNIATILKSQQYTDVSNLPGAGAAGGLGAGAVAFLGAKIHSGISFIMEAIDFEEKIKQADLVITGEGKLDQQSLSGKVVSGVAKVAKKHGVPTIVVCGAAEKVDLTGTGIQKVYTLLKIPKNVEEAMEMAMEKIVEIGMTIIEDIKNLSNN